MTHAEIGVCALAALVLSGCGDSRGAADGGELRSLQDRIAALEHRKTRVADVNAIERLQAAYGYYVDRALWDEAANLFADGLYARKYAMPAGQWAVTKIHRKKHFIVCCGDATIWTDTAMKRLVGLHTFITHPGTTLLTRMLDLPTSRASPRVKPPIAAFAVTYAGMPPMPTFQLSEPKLMIDPPPACFMPGITACAAKN